MRKKAQHIIFGSIFLLFLFFLVIAIFFDDLFSGGALKEERFDLIQSAAVRAADSLTRQGYPLAWDETNVRRIGLATSKGSFDHDKQAALDSLYAANGYEALKPYLGVQDEYYLAVGTSVYSDGLATEQELSSRRPSYLATQTRHLYDDEGTLITITLHLYEE